MTAEWWIWCKRRHAKEATSVNEVTNLYQANELNQYTNINEGAVEPVYDADGNMTSYGSWQFTWDAENRLVKVAPHYLITGSRIYEYGYDFMSRRVKKTEKRYTMPMSTWTMRTFDYDGWNIIRERVEFDGAVSTNQYVWGLDLSQSLQGAGGVGGLLMVVKGRANPPGEPLFPSYDANGNITNLVDTNGAVVAHYEYDPYGNTIAQSGDFADLNPFRFSSKYWDGETGFYYYGYRFYSPALGRWINRDLFEERGGNNVYAFLRNQPTTRIDAYGNTPDGNDTEPKKEDCNALKDGMVSGGVRCTQECKMEVEGCDTWPPILQSCCTEHEELHIQQCKDHDTCSKEFCRKKCFGLWGPCSSPGRPLGISDFGGQDGANEAEREAHKQSINCYDNLLKGALSNEERKMVEQRRRCSQWSIKEKYK